MAPLLGFDVIEVASGLDDPVWVGTDPATDELVVLERPGRIVAAESGTVLLDIRGRVASGSSEQGLLGLAYHPQDSDIFYVNYTDVRGDTVVAEYRRADGVMSAESERILFVVSQPAPNHNGGNLAFGPDGYLYVGMGDGGGANDRFGTGQNADVALGSMLRIEVTPDQAEPFAIPNTNPFADDEFEKGAVWAIGLRNPWRFAFDGTDLYIADVGQRRIEEVSVVDVSEGVGELLNFGWPILEGDTCFAGGDSCDRAGLIEPVVQYGHDEGCSITGGVVMHDPAIPELDGYYAYGDFCSGWIAAFRYDGIGVIERELITGLSSLSSFGVDAGGALQIASLNGSIYELIALR